jgi:hypothetical protein
MKRDQKRGHIAGDSEKRKVWNHAYIPSMQAYMYQYPQWWAVFYTTTFNDIFMLTILWYHKKSFLLLFIQFDSFPKRKRKMVIIKSRFIINILKKVYNKEILSIIVILTRKIRGNVCGVCFFRGFFLCICIDVYMKYEKKEEKERCCYYIIILLNELFQNFWYYQLLEIVVIFYLSFVISFC